jgi:hypothetical protein
MNKKKKGELNISTLSRNATQTGSILTSRKDVEINGNGIIYRTWTPNLDTLMTGEVDCSGLPRTNGDHFSR